MNRAQHAALSKIVKNIADELDELSLVVDSVRYTDHENAEIVDKHYLALNDAWYWFESWFDEQEIQDENPARLQ